MKDFGKRTLSGIVGIILLIIVVAKGGGYLSFAIYLLSIIGLREFYKAFENINIIPVEIVGYIGCTGLYLNLLGFKFISMDFVLASIIVSLLILLITKKEVTIEGISVTVLSLIYIPFLFFHIVYLDKSKYIWLIFIIAFGTDTFAYLSGNLFGKRKLCPKLSPNKTIEGSLGGIIGSIILTVLYSMYFGLEPIWKLIILSIVCSVIAQLGDLAASKIKRISGIKDYGFIMPGHGGVLDRFDSILFTAPVVYYYVSCFLL